MTLNITLPPSLSEFVADQLEGELVTTQWDCDIRSILANVIQRHRHAASEQGEVAEPRFSGATPRLRSLAELIRDNLEYLPFHTHLSSGVPLYLCEAFAQTPNAQILRFNYGGGMVRVMAFHTPIVYYVNQFFSTYMTLVSDEVTAGCLPEDRERMQSPEYDDLTLLASLYDGAEVLYDKRFVHRPIAAPFLGPPFDLCEMVEGARRFIVAHEVGHLFLDELTADPQEADRLAALREWLQDWTGGAVPDTLLDLWVSEIWCDAFAIDTLDFLYADRLGVSEYLNEAANAACGVVLFYFMLYFLETGLRHHDGDLRGYPPAYVRFAFIRDWLKAKRIYHDEHVSRTIRQFYHRLRTARQVISGLGFSPKHGSVALALPLYLGDFGREMSRAIFHDLASGDNAFDAIWGPGVF